MSRTAQAVLWGLALALLVAAGCRRQVLNEERTLTLEPGVVQRTN